MKKGKYKNNNSANLNYFWKAVFEAHLLNDMQISIP